MVLPVKPKTRAAKDAVLSNLGKLRGEGPGKNLKGFADEDDDDSNERKPGGKPEVQPLSERELMAGAELGGEYNVPIGEFFASPDEVAKFQYGLSNAKPEDLKLDLTKEVFENKRNRAWINRLLSQLNKVSKKTSMGDFLDTHNIQPPPPGMSEGLGVEETGGNKELVQIMKTIGPFLMVRDLMKDDAGDSKAGVIRYKSPTGEEYEYPAGQAPPNMMGPVKEKEEQVTVKIGDTEITGTQQYVTQMMTLLQPNKTNDEDSKLLGIVQALTREMAELKAGPREEKMITVVDEAGTQQEIPAGQYSTFLLTKQLANAQQEMNSRRDEDRGGRGEDEGSSVQVARAVSQMSDAMRRMGEVMSPENVGDMAMQGLMGKAQEFEQFKRFWGGSGSAEDPEVAIARIKEDGETRRAGIKEEERRAELEEKRIASETASKRLEAVLSGVGAPHQEEVAPTPAPLEDVLERTARRNEQLLKEVESNREEEEG